MSLQRWMPILLAVGVAACGPPADQRTETLDVEEARQERAQQSPELLGHMEAGNTAFREGDIEGARDHFTAAVELDDGYAAAWFGVYMAEKELGNVEAAQRALEAAQAEAPGATLIHPTAEDSVG